MMQAGSLLLRNGVVYPAVDGWEPGEMDIRIENGRIAALGPGLAEDGARVIDLAGRTVFPGLIDAHCHIGLFGTAMGERGVDGNENTAACTPELRAVDGLNPFDPEFRHAVEHGVTTVSTGPGSANAICGQFATLKTHGKTLDDRMLRAPSAMKMAFGENPKSAHDGAFPVTRMGTAAAVREALFKARRYAEDKEAARRESRPLPAFDMKAEALLPVLAGRLPVKAHAHRADDILTALRIAREFHLDMSIEHCSEGHLIPDELAYARGVILGPLLGFPHKLEQANQTAAAACVLHAHGVKFALMSDLPASHTGEILTEVCACIREGLPPAAALKAITVNAAEILGVGDRVGAIRPGLDADLAVFDANPLEFVRARCVMTLVDGEAVYGAA